MGLRANDYLRGGTVNQSDDVELIGVNLWAKETRKK